MLRSLSGSRQLELRIKEQCNVYVSSLETQGVLVDEAARASLIYSKHPAVKYPFSKRRNIRKNTKGREGIRISAIQIKNWNSMKSWRIKTKEPGQTCSSEVGINFKLPRLNYGVYKKCWEEQETTKWTQRRDGNWP